MTMQHRTLAILAAVSSSLLGCASPYDQELVRQRTRSLYRATAPAELAAELATDLAVEPELSPPELVAAELFEDADLERYVAYGLANGARLRAAFEQWLALTERVEQVSTLPEPRFSYGEFLEDVQTRTGPQERRFGVSQAFPWPGKLGARASVAERQAEAAWYRVELERLQLVAEIETAFCEYGFLGRELAITERLLELLRGLEPVVQTRTRSGGGQADLLRLQVEIGRLEDEVASIERRRPALSAQLAHAMQLRAGHGPLPVPVFREPAPQTLDTQRLREQALTSNPGLQGLSQELLASRRAEDLASYRRRPEFALGLDYFQTGSAVNSSTAGSGDDPVMLGFSLSLPIWTSSYAAAEREARHHTRASQQRVEAAASELESDIEQQAFRIDDASRRMRLYQDSLIPRASEALQLTQASYRTGEASLLDLIDSERALLEFELSLARSQREYVLAEARLKVLTGTEIR